MLSREIPDYPFSSSGWLRLKKFFETAKERQIIYTLKELGRPRPWTQDSQFNTWYFCNVFRRNDKVTKWIIENVIRKYESHEDLWKKIILARRLSRISSMDYLATYGGFDSLGKAKRLLWYLKEMGQPILTNAFVMGIPDPSLGSNKIDFIFNLIDFYEKRGIEDFLVGNRSIESVTRFLMSAPNMGGFLSYEIATDFTYSRYLYDATDKMTWANPGPGCKRGLNVIEFGDPDFKNVDDKTALTDMRSILGIWKIEVENNIEKWIQEAKIRANTDLDYVEALMGDFLNLSMREVEHWLCEFDKHERTRPNKRTYP
jgi:hypothetical protein